MSRILIGSASWTDKSLIDSGLFYPPAIRTADERLRYYATQSRWWRWRTRTMPCPWPAMPCCGLIRYWRIPVRCQGFPAVHPASDPTVGLAEGYSRGRGGDPKNLYCPDVPEELLGALWERFRVTIEPC
jgi:hypothetical protein